MATINIKEADATTYKDFMAGNSVQVRAVCLGNEDEYMKGKEVDVVHLNMEATGRIVSDPITIDDNAADKKVLSLIIEKVD